jgi:hypothetical protein
VDLILFNLVTLDGFFARPDGELDWHRTDDEFDRFGVEQVRGARARPDARRREGVRQRQRAAPLPA